MIAAIDAYSVCVLVISLGVLVARYVRHDPPIFPYVLIAAACAASALSARADAFLAAFSLNSAALFLFLVCLLAPHSKGWSRRGLAGTEKTRIGRTRRLSRALARSTPIAEPVVDPRNYDIKNRKNDQDH